MKNAYFTFKAIFVLKTFKVNESRYIVISGFIKKNFLIEFVNIFFSQIFFQQLWPKSIFSQYFFQWLLPIFIFSKYFIQQILPSGKVWRTPHWLHSDSLTLNFCLDFLVIYKNSLIRKIRLFSKYMSHNLGNKQLQDTLANISGSKGNQTMRFGQFIYRI